LALKFVHAADLHLDSPFAGLRETDNDIADFLQNATFAAFDNVIKLCIEREVDFLLVAGDVYDGADRSLRAQLAFRDGLRKLAKVGIHSYVVHGNHDSLDGWASSLEWPDEAYIFGGTNVESVPFERNGAVRAIIHGISFSRRDIRTNLARKFKASDSKAVQIGLLHCNVGSNTGHEPYAPCEIDDLAASHMDYWALGHVHSKNVLLEENPTVAYPGNTQGRHINEAGPRGCLYVQISDTKEVQTQFIPIDSVRWTRESVHIEHLDSDERLLNDLESRVERIQSKAEGRPSVCRLTLCGRGTLHATLQRSNYVQDLIAQLREFGRELDPLVWLDTIETQTRPAVDIEARRQAQDIVGDCLRLIEQYRADSACRSSLKDTLKKLYEDRRCGKYLEMPDDEELVSLLDDAEVLCLDKLIDEDMP